ncbi:MAG TPA: hypothetical protein VFC06_06735, partial [Demequina sp.]|nr:hypothetical protein [Demequina sp.]
MGTCPRSGMMDSEMYSQEIPELRLPAEQRARALIDAQLTAAGWAVQDKRDLNLFAAEGVAVREFTLAPGHGRADYLLFVDQRAVGRDRGQTAGHAAGRRGVA